MMIVNCIKNGIFLFLFILVACSEPVIQKKQNSFPPIFPDYVGVTIPPNIAPLNFEVKNAQKTKVLITGENSSTIIKGRTLVDIPLSTWRRLLSKNRNLTFEVTAFIGKEWIEYVPFSVFIASDSIDYGLCYRRIAPGYALFGDMGIYERDLSNFNERTIWKNTVNGGGCVNCHSFQKGNPHNMQLHLRSETPGTMIKYNDTTIVLQTKTDLNKLSCTYPYWHPQGRYIAYSINNIEQIFHNSPREILDVYDSESEIAVYDIRTNTLLFYPLLRKKGILNTYPAFSSDGKTLFFCSAKAETRENRRNIRYSLYSVDFDPATGEIGKEIRLLYSDENGSVSFPRPSYDGHYLMFAKSAYGNFSIWHSDADLYLLDLFSGDCRSVDELNSQEAESYHSWSSSSRWLVFSSRRIDGLYTRPYLAHINEKGNFSKPFILPQKDPDYYDNLMQSYNIPEFIIGNIDLKSRKIVDTPRKKVKTFCFGI